ncbi:MAG: YihY/virulence factor BrkB family protein [Thermodesulfovibrionia bacterium]|nr:YihY/virulence factor BrkB family protein [Thermodesulfovibrionia bacterium]
MAYNRKNITDFIKTGLWEIDTSSLSRFKALAVWSVRLFIVVFREVTEGQLTLRAMGLVYTTLLAMVPLLAVSLSILKGFGLHNQVMEPFLRKFLAPFGEKGAEITSHIISFVDNMKVGVLGSLGMALLVYTVISVIQKFEGAFNAIWRIKRSRSFARKFSDYISILLVGPLLMFSAIGITASFTSNTIVRKITNIEPFGSLFYVIAQLLPYVLVCGAFTFFYLFIPNTKVKFKSALIGGIFAGILWETTGWGFAAFTVSSTKYSAIYSGFAILLMFMIWLYLNWLIILAGAQIAFLHQHPELIGLKDKVLYLSNSLKERLALIITFLICYNYHHNKEHLTIHSLINYLRLPEETIDKMVTLLKDNGLLIETNEYPPAYIPAKEIDTISLYEIVSVVRSSKGEIHLAVKSASSIPEVNIVMESLDDSIRNTLGSKTIKDLILSAGK